MSFVTDDVTSSVITLLHSDTNFLPSILLSSYVPSVVMSLNDTGNSTDGKETELDNAWYPSGAVVSLTFIELEFLPLKKYA